MLPWEWTVIGLAWLVSILTTVCFGLIPPLMAVIISYWVTKMAQRPMLDEAVKIRKMVVRALKGLGPEVFREFKKRVGNSKGGKSVADPLGNFLNDKTGGLFGYLQKSAGGNKDQDRVEQIVKEEAEKKGLGSLFKKKAKEEEGAIPVIK